MGTHSSKIWIPGKDFEKICLEQGFQAISPPIYATKYLIHSIDLSKENRIYYVERSTQPNFPIQKKTEAVLETNKQNGNTILIRKDDTNYIVLEMEAMINTGDIYIHSITGNYSMKRSYFTHENFPKFAKTQNKEYNRLKGLFEYTQYTLLDTTE